MLSTMPVATLISLWVPAQELLFLAVIATSTLVTAVLVETATRSESAIATRHALSSPESTASTKAAVIRFSSTRMASSALEHLRLGLLAQQAPLELLDRPERMVLTESTVPTERLVRLVLLASLEQTVQTAQMELTELLVQPARLVIK